MSTEQFEEFEELARALPRITAHYRAFVQP